MANQLGSLVIAPRTYTRHARYRRFDRIKDGANQFSAFLSVQADRLEDTVEGVFDTLKEYTGTTQKSAQWIVAQEDA